MAAAMRTGSAALATAVLRRTADAPSSMAMTASDAVPMPASTTTGTGERLQMSSILAGLATPPHPGADERAHRHDGGRAHIGEPLADNRIVIAIRQHGEAARNQLFRRFQ